MALYEDTNLNFEMHILWKVIWEFFLYKISFISLELLFIADSFTRILFITFCFFALKCISFFPFASRDYFLFWLWKNSILRFWLGRVLDIISILYNCSTPKKHPTYIFFFSSSCDFFRTFWWEALLALSEQNSRFLLFLNKTKLVWFT